MKYSLKRGSILIYALVLVTISLTMATIMLSSSVTLSLNHDYVNIKNKLSRVISDNSRIVFKLARTLNSNGGGFADNLSCPDNMSMSGSTNHAIIPTELYVDDSSIYCLGTYLGTPVKLYFNSNTTNITLAEYSGSIVTLVDSLPGKVGSSTFSDSDNTMIDFSGYDYTIGEGFDDNTNSDNYTISSTGATLYNAGFQDDDALHRKIKFGYITPGTGFNSIFWNNTRTTNYIDKNPHNTDSRNSKIGLSENGILYLSLNKGSKIYIYEFDKQSYIDFGELKIINKFDGVFDSGEGYIQKTGGILGLSSAETGRSDYLFDFTLKDYAILLQNTTSEVLSYSIKGYDSILGQDLYIVPIEDSDEKLLKYLGNSIIIDSDQGLISEQKEVVSSK